MFFVQKITSKSGWIQGLAKGEGGASEAESCQCSQAEWCKQTESHPFVARVQVKGPGSFWDILETLSFLTVQHQKTDKNSFYFSQFEIFYMLHL